MYSSSAAGPWAAPSPGNWPVPAVHRPGGEGGRRGRRTSGRNSAVVHAYFNNRPELDGQALRGGEPGLFPPCARSWTCPFGKPEKILVAFDETDLATLRRPESPGRGQRLPGAGTPGPGAAPGQAPQVGGIGGFFSRRRGSATPSCTPWPWRRMPWPTGWPSS